MARLVRWFNKLIQEVLNELIIVCRSEIHMILALNGVELFDSISDLIPDV